MAHDETSTVTDEEAPPDESAEAEGVAAIDASSAEMAGEDAGALDAETLGELDDEERAEVEQWAGEDDTGAEAAGSLRLSKNFVLAEFHCCRSHCAGAHVPGASLRPLRTLVVEVLQPMRDKFGACSVHSAFRNQAHNAHVGGVSNSYHRYNLRPNAPAADVAFARGNPEAWAAEARRRLGNRGGIGKYPSQRFVHVDLGPKRHWVG